jgi:GT2 family glycosyltransferase
MFSTIIPSKNETNLRACVSAIRAMEEDCRIIVVDDGLGNRFYGDGFQLEYVNGAKPFIFSRNINLGIAAVGEDDIIILNDDALLQTPKGFSRLSTVSQMNPEFGVISSACNNVGNANQYPKNQGLRVEPRILCFVCVYIPRPTINSIGLLDERFTTYGWEDNDYCKRVQDEGLKLGIYDGCFVDHFKLTSTFRGGPRAAGDIEPGRRIFNAKWGIA